MYNRIFGSSRRFQIALWLLGSFIATYSFIQFLVILLQCSPIQGAWEYDIGAKCIHLMLELEIMGGFNALTDILTVALPLYMVWGLQMDLKRKLQVAATFLVGGFVCVVSIIRVPMEAGISLQDASCMSSLPCGHALLETQ